MAEVQETPFAIDGGTPSIIDERVPHENAQPATFKFQVLSRARQRRCYFVLYHVFSENSAEDWIKADLYQYRITLD